jgi:restriction system protein
MIEFCARLLPHANRKVSFKDKAITTGEQVEMARGSGSGSYRQWAAEQRAAERASEQAAKKAEAERRAGERERAAAESAARDEDALSKSAALDQRIAELETLLLSSLTNNPRISFTSLKRSVTIPPLNLGTLANPVLPPQWDDFEPPPLPRLQRMFGGSQRYQSELDDAARRFAQVQANNQQQEAARRRRVAEAEAAWKQKIAELQREVDAYNARIDALAIGFREHDRFAVSEYVQMVLDRSPYPTGFPTERHAGYVPESCLLAVEWYLPTVDVVPEYKAYRHIKTRKAVEPVGRPFVETGSLYQSIIAQIALRTLREIFHSTPEDMISTVVFNGRVTTIDPLTGQTIQPHLITLRATREQFAPLILDQPKFQPVACVRRYFFADISPHPEELIPVEPVMPYSMADPRVIEPIDVISGIDKRPNLLELTPKDFEAFIQNLFTKMGFDTKLYKASGDGGIDCVAFDPHPITGGKFIVQAKLYTRTVAPTHVRDLWGTVQHEGATKGIMITTSGYGPDSYKFAAGKPINLIDGSGLLSICHQHDIPARILNSRVQ